MSEWDENGWNEDDDVLDAAILEDNLDDEKVHRTKTTTTTISEQTQLRPQIPYNPLSSSAAADTAFSHSQKQYSNDPAGFAEQEEAAGQEGWKDDDSVLEDLLIDDDNDRNDVLDETVVNAAGIMAPHLTLNLPPHAPITASTVNMAEEEDSSFPSTSDQVPKTNDNWDDGWENDDVNLSDLDPSERDSSTHRGETDRAVVGNVRSGREEGLELGTNVPSQPQPPRLLAPHLHLNTIPDRRSMMVMPSAPTTASTVDLLVDGWDDEDGVVDEENDSSVNEFHKNDDPFEFSSKQPNQQNDVDDMDGNERPNESLEDRKYAASPVKTISVVNDGWSENDVDEEGDFFADDADDDHYDKGTAHATSQTDLKQVAMQSKASHPLSSAKKKDMSDGWDEENDFFKDDDDLQVKGVEDQNHHGQIDAKPPTKAIPFKTYPSSTARVKEQETVKAKTIDGWDNDDDEDFFNDDDDVPLKPSSIQPKPSAPDVSHKQPKSSPPVPLSSSTTSNAMVHRLSQELYDYLFTLPAHVMSVAAVLQAEYNTPEKAFELKQYYVERPALEKYTIQKELARMEYMLTDHTGSDVITDKNVIAQQIAGSLCARCANQSLLADMLQVLTGPDRVVRPQYFASAIASMCRFRIDLQHSLTEVVAALELSLPSAHGRWKVAEIRVMIIFGCGPMPFVEYRLADIVVIASPKDRDWRQRLEQTAAMLTDLFEHEEIPPALAPSPMLQQGQNFRDVFLQSQSVAMEAAAAMKSAWQDIDAATGFGRKMRQLPAFLPDASVLAAAEEEERRTSMARKSREEPVQRPTSIIGGFVSKLAKSVALPDEDPELYQEWNKPSKPLPSSPPQLYKKAPPVLYNASREIKDTSPKPTTNMPDDSAFPRLYKKEAPLFPSEHQRPIIQPSVLSSQALSEASFVSPSKHDIHLPVAETANSGIPNLDRKGTTALLVPETGKNVQSSKPIPLKPECFSVTPSCREVLPEETPEPIEAEFDDQDKNVLVSNADQFASSKTPVQQQSPVHPKQIKGWEYDPVTDIIPTRKRWVHPRPGPRDLSALSSFHSRAVTQH